MTRHAKISAALWFTALALVVLTVLLALCGCGPQRRDPPAPAAAAPGQTVTGVAMSLTENAEALRVIAPGVPEPTRAHLARVAGNLDANADRLDEAEARIREAQDGMAVAITDLEGKLREAADRRSLLLTWGLAIGVLAGMAVAVIGAVSAWMGGGKLAIGIAAGGVLLSALSVAWRAADAVVTQYRVPLVLGAIGICAVLATVGLVLLIRRYSRSVLSAAQRADRMEDLAGAYARAPEALGREIEAENTARLAAQESRGIAGMIASIRRKPRKRAPGRHRDTEGTETDLMSTRRSP